MKQIELVYDFSCPLCYQQLLVFDSLRKNGYSFEVKPIPFLLESNTPMEGRLFSEEEKVKLASTLNSLKDSLPVIHSASFAEVTHSYNTYPAHLVALGVYKLGDYLSFALDVFSSYFENNQNISSKEILSSLLEKQNLDYDKVLGIINADEMRMSIFKGFQIKKELEEENIPFLLFSDVSNPLTLQSYEQLKHYFE